MNEVGDQPVEAERPIKTPLIIGVGASPGALDSIERFFAKLTVGADQAIDGAARDGQIERSECEPGKFLGESANFYGVAHTI